MILSGIPESEVNPNDVNAAVVHGNQLKDMDQAQIDSILHNHE